MREVRYTWSRWAPNPIEHVAGWDLFAQPICGTRLVVERQTFGPAPTGFGAVCERCMRKLRKMREKDPMSFATATSVAEVDKLERELLSIVRKIREQLPIEAQYRLLDHVNAVAGDEFGDEYDKVHG
jgi:hypothetical protein